MLRKNPFGTWGVILGLLAFGAGLMHFWIGPIETDTRTVKQKIVDKTFAIKDSLAAKISSQPSRANPEPHTTFDVDKAVSPRKYFNKRSKIHDLSYLPVI